MLTGVVSMCSGAVTGDDDVEDKGEGVGALSVETGWGDTSLLGRANGCSGWQVFCPPCRVTGAVAGGQTGAEGNCAVEEEVRRVEGELIEFWLV